MPVVNGSSPDEHAALVERHDRIGHQLPGAVVGHLAATLDPDDLDAASLELLGARPDVPVGAVPPEGQHRRMLEQQELIADASVRPVRGQLALQRMPVAVRDPAQPRGVERVGPGGVEDGGGHRRTIAGRASPTCRRVL